MTSAGVLRKPRLLALLALLTMAACGSAGEGSLFWDGDGDVRGADARIEVADWNLDQRVAFADAAVTVTVTGIAAVEMPPPLSSDISVEDPADQWKLDRDRKTPEAPLATTYSATVNSWLKGSGEESLLIRGPGGVTSDGVAAFPDGFFLLEPGRTYVLLLNKDASGVYDYGMAIQSFDVTGGVHVLNHPLTRDLEYYEEMSVDDFVAHVKGLADSSKAVGEG